MLVDASPAFVGYTLTIFVQSIPRLTIWSRCRTNHQGEFSFESPIETSGTLYFEHADYLNQSWEVGPTHDGHQLRLRRGGQLSGTLLINGKRTAAARVAAMCGSHRVIGTTGERGEFQFRGLRSGIYEVILLRAPKAISGESEEGDLDDDAPKRAKGERLFVRVEEGEEYEVELVLFRS